MIWIRRFFGTPIFLLLIVCVGIVYFMRIHMLAQYDIMDHINTDELDWYSLESKYLDIEKEENKKKYEKKLIIKKKNS